MSGEQLAPRREEITIEKLRQHAPGQNVHTDYEIAREYGYPAPPASGSMFMGYMSEWLFEEYGDDWLESGEITCKFVNIVTPGDTLVVEWEATETAEGVEIDIEGRRERDDEEAEVAFVGTASVGPS